MIFFKNIFSLLLLYNLDITIGIGNILIVLFVLPIIIFNLRYGISNKISRYNFQEIVIFIHLIISILKLGYGIFQMPLSPYGMVNIHNLYN